jgi:starch phosphorylase
MFIFGHTAMELELLRRKGYVPRSFYEGDEELRRVVDWMLSGSFDGKSGGLDPVRRVAESLLAEDSFCALADYRKYLTAQELASNYYLNSELWYSMAILTVARMGKFSSDRTIREYARDIWHLSPLSVP